MENNMEIYESKDGGARFYFTHSSSDFTTGVLVMKPQYELPKHNRPLAVENLVQISGKCTMKLFSSETDFSEHILKPGDHLQIPKGQYHIHANPNDTESATLFKAVGDITKVMDALRQDCNLIKSF
jgi:quercetin dioxygenase-like cupin family protein